MPGTEDFVPPAALTEDEYFDDRWIAGSMAIANYGCGHHYLLVVTGEERGQVWFDGRARRRRHPAGNRLPDLVRAMAH